MMINMDLDQTISVNTADLDWSASPEPSILRKKLERELAEEGRATSIVQYKAGASFDRHSHPGITSLT